MQKSFDRARDLSELVLKQGLERAMADGGVTSFDRKFIATTEFAKGFDLSGGLFVGGLQDTYRYYRTQCQQNWARKMLYGMSFNSTREQLSDLQYYGAIIAAAIPGVGLAGRMARVFSRIPTNRLTSRLGRGYSVLNSATRSGILRAAGDDLIDDFARITGKQSKLSQKQIDRLLSRGAKGLEVNRQPSVEKLWNLSRQTNAEWSFYDLNGKMYIHSGDATSVAVRYNKTTTEFIHTHLTNYKPSMDDYNLFMRMRRPAPGLKELKIIHNGELLKYDLDLLELLKRSGQLKYADPL